MPYKYLFFIFLDPTYNSKTISYLITGSLIFFRDQIGDLLSKKYKITINEVKDNPTNDD